MSYKSMSDAVAKTGIKEGTIRNWIAREELQVLFSNEARTADPHREFTDNDVLILNTINHKRNKEESQWSWDDIREWIQKDDKNRVTEFPVTEALDIQTRNEAIDMLGRAKATIEELRAQNEELKAQLAAERQARLEDKERLNRELTQREIEFVKQIAVLEYRLSQHE